MSRTSRRALALGDQVLSSLSNVLAIVLVARALSPADFGRFSLAYAVLSLVVLLTRAYVGTGISLAPDAATARRRAGGAVALLGVAAVPVALLVLGVSAAAGRGGALGLLVVVALATPVVCLQDVLRFAAAAGDRPLSALLSDGAWVLVLAVPLVLRLSPGPLAALLLWLAGAVLALVVAAATAGVRPGLRTGLAGLRERDGVGEALTYGAVVSSTATLWVLSVAAAAVSPAAAGSLRGAATALGPVNVLLAFLTVGLTPALARRPRGGDLAFCAATGAAVAAATVVWGGALLLAPHAVGVGLFGASWDGIRHLLPWTLLEYVALSLSSAAVLGLKVRGAARALVRQRMVAGAVAVAVGSAAALAAGKAWPVSAALGVAALCAVATGWSSLVRAVPAAQPAPDADDLVAGTVGAPALAARS